MNRTIIFAGLAALWLTAGASSCGTPPNPGPNPACASAATAIGSGQQALGIAETAWSIGQVFITNATIKLAITTALDSATVGLAKAQDGILAGNCDVQSYVTAAAEAIKTALADIAAGRTAAPGSSAPAPGPDMLGAMIAAGNDKANQAEAGVK